MNKAKIGKLTFMTTCPVCKQIINESGEEFIAVLDEHCRIRIRFLCPGCRVWSMVRFKAVKPKIVYDDDITF